MILKRDYTYSGVGSEQLQQQIDSLESQIKTLQSAAKGGSTRINAEEAGYFSSLVDGYESVLTPQLLEEITPSTLKNIRPTGDTSGVGKVVQGSRWYYAAAMDTADIGKLTVGDTVTLRFVSSLERDFAMEVVSIGAEENGQRVVVLSSDRYQALTTLLRQQNAQIIFHAYTGIRVPTEAVHTDEHGQTYVYTLTGIQAERKDVNILYTGGDFCLVKPSGDAGALREGNDVILSAGDLYDGKVLEQHVY